MTIKILSTTLLCLYVTIGYSQTSISWYSFNTGFVRGAPSVNNGVGLGSVVGQPFVGEVSNGNITIISGFTANDAIKDITSEVGKFQESLPIAFSLFQNYPNPFNPTTTIRFSLRERSKVKLVVYNILGQIVATPVDEELHVGEYEARFEASTLPSGVYFYRLTANDFVQSRRMLLLK